MPAWNKNPMFEEHADQACVLQTILLYTVGIPYGLSMESASIYTRTFQSKSCKLVSVICILKFINEKQPPG